MIAMAYTSILAFGADNTGANDISIAFEKAFAAGIRDIFVPMGTYRLDRQLLLPSHAHILLDAEAVVFAAPGIFRDYSMVRSADPEQGNADISVSGGQWDGRCDANMRCSYRDEDFVGMVFTFNNVDGLTLHNLRMRRASCYYIRLGEVRHFTVSGIRFEGQLAPLCQDGIHVGGGSEYGCIKDLWAEPGSMGDDLVAFNADDVFWYAHNHGMKALPIRHMTVQNVQAENCFTGVRLLSVTNEISDVHFSNMRIGYRQHGINLDAARHCEDPIPEVTADPLGVGNIHDITFENTELWYTGSGAGRECVTFETNVKSMTFTDIRCPRLFERGSRHPLFRFACMNRMELAADGETRILSPGEVYETPGDGFKTLTVRTLD